MKIFFRITCLLCLFPCLAMLPVHAQWNTDASINTPICIAGDRQIDERILEDGHGGAFIVWKDYRQGLPDIYVQRVDSLGQVMWVVDGLGACTQAADQSTPGICSDAHGGCIVAWSDWRSGIERDLYAQRIDPNGNMLWTANGAPLAIKVDREHNERICSDGLGGAIAVWEQQSGAGWDVWAQHLDANGSMTWANGGLPVSTYFAYRINGRIQADGLGGAYIAWQELHNGVDYDIYGQHFDALGNRLWGVNGIAIGAGTGTQITAKIERDYLGNGAYFAWQDDRNGAGYDLYAQRIDANGNALWAANGVAATAATANQSAVDILTGPDIHGLILTWKDARSGNNDIYAQRLSPAGTAMWTADGTVLCNVATEQVNPNIVGDMAGGAIVVWQHSIGIQYNVRAQRIDSMGTALWTANGVDVATAFADQTSPKNCSDGHGGTIVAFEDMRAGTADIYAHHLFADGLAFVAVDPALAMQVQAWPNPFSDQVAILLTTDYGNDFQGYVTDMNGKFMGAIEPDQVAVNGNTVRIHLQAARQCKTAGVYCLHVQAGVQTAVLRIVRI